MYKTVLNKWDKFHDETVEKISNKVEISALKFNVAFNEKLTAALENKKLNKLAYAFCKAGYAVLYFGCFCLEAAYTALETMHFPFTGFKNPETGKWETFVPLEEEKKIIKDSIVKF